MINILIYNILRNDDKNISIVINNNCKERLQKKLNDKNVLLGDNIKFISEKDVYTIKEKSDLYILMYSNFLENKRRLIEIIDNNYIEIGKASMDDEDEIEEHSILIKNNKIAS